MRSSSRALERLSDDELERTWTAIAKPSNATRTPINTPARTRNDLFRARLAAPPT